MSAWSIVIAILLLGILAAFHEIGHFFVAKWLKVPVEEFSIFVGPSLFSWKKKGVKYHIRLFPFGAYVRYKGMEEEELDETDPEMFFNQPRWKRLLISLAGPFMNFLISMVIFAVIFSSFGFLSTKLGEISEGTQLYETSAVRGDRIISVNGQRILTTLDLGYFYTMTPDTELLEVILRSAATGELYNVTLVPNIAEGYRLGITRDGAYKISSVDPLSNGGEPGLLIGDILISANGVLASDEAFSAVVSESNGNPVTVFVIREEKEIELEIKTIPYQVGNPRGMTLQSGNGIGEILEQSVSFPVSYIRLSISILADMVTGKVAPQDTLAGPLGIITVVSDVVDAEGVDFREKVEQMGILAGVISVALAFSNLLPIPGLDGNSMVLLLVEMVRGKKLSIKAEMVINVIGFVCLILLAGFALFSDIFRLVG